MAGRNIARRGGQDITENAGGDALPALGGALGTTDALTLRRMAVAKQFPRDEAAIRRKLKALAPAKSEEWGWSWPVKNKRTGKTEIIDGPSIKLANAVLQATPNVDVRVEVIETDEAWIFHVGLLDLETNNMPVRTYRQRRSQDLGGGYDDGRRDDMIYALGQSKAIRNVVVNYLSELVDFAYEESRKSLLDVIRKDEGKEGKQRFRARIAEQLAKLNVNPDRVVQWLGRGTKQWTVEDIAKVTGVLAAIDQGVTSVESVWPDRTAAPPGPRAPAPRAPRNDPPPANEIPDGPGESDGPAE